jgi:hypothetical protein
MSAILLVLACIAAWFALNIGIGLLLMGDIVDAIAGTVFVTVVLLAFVAFGALVALTVWHLGGAA